MSRSLHPSPIKRYAKPQGVNQTKNLQTLGISKNRNFYLNTTQINLSSFWQSLPVTIFIFLFSVKERNIKIKIIHMGDHKISQCVQIVKTILKEIYNTV